MAKRKSIRSKYKGQSFASVSKKISDKYPNRDTDPIEMRSFMAEISELMRLQEASKTAELAARAMKDRSRPVNASKYKQGGPIPSKKKELTEYEKDLLRASPPEGGFPFVAQNVFVPGPNKETRSKDIDERKQLLNNYWGTITKGEVYKDPYHVNKYRQHEWLKDRVLQYNQDFGPTGSNQDRARLNYVSTPESMGKSYLPYVLYESEIKPKGGYKTQMDRADKGKSRRYKKGGQIKKYELGDPIYPLQSRLYKTVNDQLGIPLDFDNMSRAGSGGTYNMYNLSKVDTSNVPNQARAMDSFLRTSMGRTEGPLQPAPTFRGTGEDLNNSLQAMRLQGTLDTQMGDLPDNKQSFLKDNIYAPLAIGKGLEFVGKAAMLAGGYDTVDPQNNPYESDIRRQMQSRGINMDALRNQILRGQATAVDQASGMRNESTRQALIQNAVSNATGQLSNVSVQEQQLGNQYRADYAQTLDTLGRQRVAAENYAEQLNNQSKVGYQMGLQSVLESVGNAGQRLTDYRANIAQQQMLASALRTADFQFGDVASMIKGAVSGKQVSMDDAIQIVQNSAGKSKDQLMQEIQQAKAKFQENVSNLNQ